MLLVIHWGVIGIKTLQLILSLSILVILHEGGHYITAKWFKCRVEKFYLFFDPWFSIVKKKIGETEYGIGWIPFGGYVKISGMIDESMDKEQMKQPPQPYEFRSKPAWQRLIIMLAGIAVNVLLAIVIFAAIMLTWGNEYLPPQNLKYGMYADSLGRTIGLQDGDIITKINNQPVKNALKTVGQIMTTNDAKSITVNRNGNEVQLPVTDNLIKGLYKTKSEKFAEIRFPMIVDSIIQNSDAVKEGIKKGDRIIGVDSTRTLYAIEFFNAMKSPSIKDSVRLEILRNSDTLNFKVALNKDKKIGIFAEGDMKKLGFVTVKEKYTLLSSVPAGAKRCWDVLYMNLVGFKQIFTGKAKASESLGSVISIGNLFPSEWDWQNFWSLTAILSVILAFMNILPIPGLDGGHALFTIVEMITGRKPSDKFMEYAQMTGMIILLALMAYALGLDFMRLFK